MSAVLHTSTQFACVIAQGGDWREIGRKLLESIESIRTENDGMNVAFLYATDELSPDVGSLISLLKNITRVPSWFGATGSGICGNGISIAHAPAAVVLIGRMADDAFHAFTLPADFAGIMPAPAREWLGTHMSSVALTHGLLCAPAARSLDILREKAGLYTVGGFSSGRTGGLHVSAANVVADHPVSCVMLDDTTRIMVCTSQGCIKAGAMRQVTACKDNVISTIDGEPAFDVLKNAVDSIELPESMKQSMKSGAPRRGHVHAAFPIKGTDTRAILVRNITHADETERTLAVAHPVSKGDRIQFVYRDRETALADLSSCLRDLYARATDDLGAANMKPKALLYFGCGARQPDPEGDGSDDEAALAKSIFGDIPMAGFYTAAEICNGHVYGYTGVAILIL